MIVRHHMASSIDKHPQRQQITNAILTGQSLRSIASNTFPAVSLMALQRYSKSIRAPKSFTAKDVYVPTTCATKQWAEGELVSIVATAKLSTRPESLTVARAAVMDLARLNGWEAPRRSENVSLNLHALPSAQLAIALQSAVAGLPEHERKALLADHTIDIEPTE